MRTIRTTNLLLSLCCVSCLQGPKDAPPESPRAKALTLDPFGVAEIYPTKAGGRAWYLPATADVGDAEWNPSTGVTRNADGTFHMNNTQVRSAVSSPAGKAWWRNVEMTGYVRQTAVLATTPAVHWSWYARGERHSHNATAPGDINGGVVAPAGTATWPGYPFSGTSVNPACLGTAYHSLLYNDGRTNDLGFEKEISHTAGYVAASNRRGLAAVPLDFSQWTGFKYVLRNDPTQNTITMEIWLDSPAGSGWRKVSVATDSGGWNADAPGTGQVFLDGCDAAPFNYVNDQKITWAGPLATFRSDSVAYDFKWYSVREIDEGPVASTPTASTPGPFTYQAPSSSSQDTVNVWNYFNGTSGTAPVSIYGLGTWQTVPWPSSASCSGGLYSQQPSFSPTDWQLGTFQGRGPAYQITLGPGNTSILNNRLELNSSPGDPATRGTSNGPCLFVFEPASTCSVASGCISSAYFKWSTYISSAAVITAGLSPYDWAGDLFQMHPVGDYVSGSWPQLTVDMDGTGTPFLAFSAQCTAGTPGCLQLDSSDPNSTALGWRPNLSPDYVGRWVDFAFYIKLSTGADGVQTLWVDGQQVASWTGPNMYSGSSGHPRLNVQHGYYRLAKATSTSALYQTPVLYATALASVADFSIGATPTQVSSTAVASAQTTITAASLNSFSGSVALSASISPAGPTATFATNPVAVPSNGQATSVLTLNGNGAPAGSYTVTVTGTSGTLTHSIQVTYTITPSASPPVGSLSDSFAAASLDTTKWTIAVQQGGTVTEGGGSVNLSPSPNVGTTQLLLSSVGTYSLTSSAGYVKARSVLNAGSLDEDYALFLDNNNKLQWLYGSGTLQAVAWKAGTQTILASLPYSATSHLWWRIRESSGTVYWDTSPDGTSWTQQASSPTASLFDLSTLKVYFFAETWGTGAATPGTAKFANFNQPDPANPWADSFNGTAIDATKWSTFTFDGGTITEGGGAISLTPAPNTADSVAQLKSVNTASLIGKAASVKAVGVLNSSNDCDEDFSLMLTTGRSNRVSWYYEHGSLSALYVVNGVQTILVTLTYSPTAHVYWRIRESGGTVFWDTSADGLAWTQQASTATANLFSLASVSAQLYAETWSFNSAAPGSAQFADLR